jgi:hypothetical protein
MTTDETGTDSTVDEAALAALAGRALEAADEAVLARLLAHPAKPVQLRAAALISESISAQQMPAELLDAFFAAREVEVRWGAAFAASRAGVSDERVVDVAVEALDVQDGDVRWAAASIVTRAARESEDVRTRLRTLATSGAPRSRKMALLCLCDSGVRDGKLYRGALADADPFVRLAAMTTLVRSGDSSAESIAALRRVSEDDADARVRRGATAILSRLSSPAS